MIRPPIPTYSLRKPRGLIAPLAVAMILSAAPAAAQESWEPSREALAADVSSRDEGGQLAARNFDHGTWASASSGSLEQGFYEQEISRVTRRFGPITDVFSSYEWRTTEDGPVGGRGINSIQLFDDGERWWITGAVWASEEPGSPIPAAYLPD